LRRSPVQSLRNATSLLFPTPVPGNEAQAPFVLCGAVTLVNVMCSVSRSSNSSIFLVSFGTEGIAPVLFAFKYVNKSFGE
jgi:hypothetical protein